ncbi:hypothetical protein L1987_50311 [Smallanthus sonchifolius]|uniref:Uncharacterized protein n=1 Tax=Smallanthus sonchifolius TaxID=185202 RepID=A0ACB9ELN6_9ASTR|nr:hypothetical protein L1987_50311 [Smallanthus sonchifolius]
MTISKGSTVEVSSHGAWYAATIIDKLETSPAIKRKDKKIGYLVEYETLFEDVDLLQPLTEVVDPSFIRPSPPAPPPRVAEGFEVYDVVNAYRRDGWWIGVVKTVIVEGEMSKYVVSFQNPNEEFQFQRSDLRLHVDWVDCRWESGVRNATRDARSGFTTPSKGARNVTVGPASFAKKHSRTRKRSECTAVDRAVTRRKAFQSSAGSKGKTKVIVPVLETSRSDEINQDSPPGEHAIIITQTRESEDGTSHQKMKRERRPKLVVKKPIGLLQASAGTTTTTTTTTTDYQQDWPFIKRSPIWATIESLELYQTPPQMPHFSPLKEKKADYREGLAIAYMVTFGNLVQNLSGLQPNDPVDIINNSLETLCDLETHGFDVVPIRDRLTKLLSLKSTVCEHEDTHKKVEKEFEKCNHERSLVEKEMDELEVKMKVLKEKSAQTAGMMKVKDDEIMRLQSNLHLVSNQISDLEVAFEQLAATPL